MGAVMRAKFRGATSVLGGPGVLKDASSFSSRDASRAFRFRRDESDEAGAAPRRRVDMCDGVPTEPSSSVGSTEFPRSDLMRRPACDSLSPATVSVCERMDRLRLRSRTEPPAREEAMLPGLVRFAGAFLRERPDRVSGSSKESSSWSWCWEFCGVSTSIVDSCSASLPLPFVRDLRCVLAFGGVCFDRISGGTSSRGSTSGRGLAALPGVPVKLDRFQRLLAETGVARALCGERAFIGVEKDCLA